MGSYVSYYLLWMLLAYALREPWLLVGVAVFLVLRRFIPDPTALFRALSRGRALRAQVEINPANVTARRDLASIYLDVLRPRAALKLIQEALGRTPNDAELLYLSGLALERAGSHADALVPLVRAVELDPRVRFGEPYLVAGDALSALGRHAEAQDAYERYVDSNSSDVVGYVRLARALSRLGERKDAEQQLAEGGATWASLPGWRKRRAFWRGYFGLFWTRVWWLRQPSAIAFSLMFVAILAGLAHAAWPLAAHALSESRARAPISQFYGDRVTYRGETFRLTKRYADFDEYENDATSLRATDLPRIQQLMTEAKLGPKFESQVEFARKVSALVFPGYSWGGGPPVTAPGRAFLVASLQIPVDKDRLFVLAKSPDGSLELVDDFVVSVNSPRVPLSARLVGQKLQYLAENDAVVRETELPAR